MENVVVLPEEVNQLALNVSEEKRNEVQVVLNHVFSGVAKMREQLDKIVVQDENDVVGMKLATAVRLAVKNERLDAEKQFDAKRQEVQHEMLGCKTLDSLYLKAKQIMQIQTKELEQMARWKEETKERIEAERKEITVQQRVMSVNKFNSELQRSEFENMSDEMFDLFLSGLEKQHNDKIEAEKQAELQRLEAEKQAEIIRVEREKQIEAQRIENERLKKEADAREKQIELERKKAREEAEKLAEIERKKAQEIEAKRQAELKAEREKQAELQAQLKAKQEAEDKRIAEIENAKKEAEKLAKAPVKKQLENWVNSFELPVTSVDNDVKKEIQAKFDLFKIWAKKIITNE